MYTDIMAASRKGKSPSPAGGDIFGSDGFGRRYCIPRMATTQCMAADFRGTVDISVWPAHGCPIWRGGGGGVGVFVTDLLLRS